VGVLIEELIKHKMPVVIIYPHDEYSSLVHPNLREEEIRLMKRFGVKPKGYAENVAVYSPDPKLNTNSTQLSFNDANMDAWQIAELTSMKNPVHIGILRRIINEMKTKKKYYTLRDIRNAAEEDPNTSKWGVVNKLDFLLSTNLFSGPGMDIGDFVKPGRATIINLRGVPPETQEVAVTMIARSLFDLRKLKKILKAMLIVEEAHNFCPQEGSAGPSSILRTIASEGRKFGLGLGVVSQRPATVDKNVLSQCGVQIILKVTNPNDLKAITASFEGLTSSASDEIQRLPIGVAMVVGGNISMPVLVNVRVRETKHGGEEILEIDEIAEEAPKEEVAEEEEKQLGEVEEEPLKEEKKKKGFFARYFEEKTD
jgi:DNA helicase HerA-like ATPase